MSRELQGLDDVVLFDVFLLDCADAKHGLCSAATQLTSRLLVHLASQHRSENQRYAGRLMHWCHR